VHSNSWSIADIASSVKREIAHLCRNVTPSSDRRPSESSLPPVATHTTSPSVLPDQPLSSNARIQSQLPSEPLRPQLPASLYADANFPPSWPLLPDTSGPVTYGDGDGVDMAREGSGSGTWGAAGEDTELGALTYVHCH
jgi:hypothetical protein